MGERLKWDRACCFQAPVMFGADSESLHFHFRLPFPIWRVLLACPLSFVIFPPLFTYFMSISLSLRFLICASDTIFYSLFLFICFFARLDTVSHSVCLSHSSQSHAIITPIFTFSHQLCHRGDLEQQAADWLLCWWFGGREPSHLELMDSVARLQRPLDTYTPTYTDATSGNRRSMGVAALTNLIMWTNGGHHPGSTHSYTHKHTGSVAAA